VFPNNFGFKKIRVVATLSLFLVMTLSGCVTGQKQTKPTDGATNLMSLGIAYDHQVKPRKYEGSLWEDNGALSSLFKDYKASKVGDVVTVILDEYTTANNKADTNTSRDSSVKAGFGAEFSNIGNLQPNYSGAVSGSFKPSFTGSGSTNRESRLKNLDGVTARVVKVLPDGNLVIAGSREITVNNETQCLTLAGLIQPRDIRYNMATQGYEVKSSRISDAKFVYSGEGIVSQRQNPGWLSNLMNVVWPF
jgi:flagellar L-ring protein precursor FlgH